MARAAKDDAKASDVRPAISEKKLKQLLTSCRSGAKDIASITGELREKIGYAKEHDHLHTGAFALIRKLDRLEPEKLADFLDCMDHYLDISGLRDRAASAPRLDMSGEQEEDETGEGGKKGGRKRGGDDAGVKTNGANVKPFPAPNGVAAE